MFRAASLLLVFCFAVACGNSNPLTINVANIGEGVTEFPELKVNIRSLSAQYKLQVASLTDKSVRLKVRLEDGATAGMEVNFKDTPTILPGGKEDYLLVFRLPDGAGKFRARATVTSDDLDGWSVTYTVSGEKRDEPMSGRFIYCRPNSINLRAVREGSKQKFSFTLENPGDESTTVSRIEVLENAEISLGEFMDGTTIAPAGALTVNGEFTVPARVAGETFRADLMIHSDASNAERRVFTISGRIERDYLLQPPQLPKTSLYLANAPKFDVRVLAREGGEAFRITGVSGLKPYFELGAPLSKDAKTAHVLPLRIRKDAPNGVDFKSGVVRVQMDNPSRTVDWPYRIRVLPPIFPQPTRIAFGTLESSRIVKPVKREFSLVATPGRKYKVTDVRAEAGRFLVRKIEIANMPVRIEVSLPAFAEPGDYRDKIMIETDDPDVPRIQVRVGAVVR